MSHPIAATDSGAAADRPPTQDERLLAQVGQSLIAMRAQAVAVVEACNASLMIVAALQDREEQRIQALQAASSPKPPTPPRTFGSRKTTDD